MDSGQWPKLEYIPIENRVSLYFDGETWGEVSYIVPCIRCGRFTDDETRDVYGGMMPDHLISEEDRNPVCQECSLKDIQEAFESDTLALIEEKLGLSEKDRGALKSFIETVFTDPKKILKVQELDNRVEGLERQKTFLLTAVGVSIAFNAICISVVVAIAIAVFG